jgi:cleavage stimulation factor subunit 2
MVDSATGKPKGFGFADFADADAAASAVRNLNDYEINWRKIRVDWPHAGEKDAAPTGYDAGPITNAPPMLPSAPVLPPLPSGIELPPNLKCTDAISQTLSTLPPQQLLDVLTQMKGLAISDPGRAVELLRQAPQLSYAIFQALILMKLVDPQVLAQVVEQAARPPTMAPIALPQQQPPQQYQGFPPPMQQQFQPPRPQPPPQYAPPPMAQPQPPPPNQNDLLQQVLAMSQQQIDTLPPLERSQIMQVRASMGVH